MGYLLFLHLLFRVIELTNFFFLIFLFIDLFEKILNKRAVEASEKERPIPDIRTGDIVEIKLVIAFFLAINN